VTHLVLATGLGASDRAALRVFEVFAIVAVLTAAALTAAIAIDCCTRTKRSATVTSPRPRCRW
jgi:hypothetical protein